jgi:hypothetical protein
MLISYGRFPVFNYETMVVESIEQQKTQIPD